MAIAAGGKKVVFSGKTATATDKTGKTQTFIKNSKGNYTAIAKDAGTQVSIVSDAPEDVGKSFGGIPIQTPEQYAQTSSGQAMQQALQTQEVNKILGPSLSKLYTDQQKKNIYQSFLQSTRAENDLKKRISQIEQNKNISVFEKERQKREAVGIITGKKGESVYNLGKELQENRIKADKQLKESLQKIEPYKKSGRLTTRSLNELENLRQEAIRGDRNARASLIGIASLPLAAVETGIEFVEGIAALFKKDTWKALTQVSGKDIQNAGANYGARLAAGNPKAITDFAVLFAPIKIPFSAELAAKISKDMNKVTSAVSDFKFKQNINKGSGTLEINTKGINQANQEFRSVIKLSIQPKTKSIIGYNKTTINNKTTTNNFVLKDSGAFYVDKATGIKIPKTSQGLQNIQVRQKTIQARINRSEDVIRATFGGKIAYGERIVTKSKQFINPKIKTTLNKQQTFQIQQALGVNEFGKKINAIAASSRTQELIKSAIGKNYTRKTPKQFDDMTKFLESVRYDIELINGIDKRTRLAYALGTNAKTTTKLIKYIDNDLKNGFIVINKGEIYATGRFETLNAGRFMLGPSFAFSNPSILQKALKTPKGIKVPQKIRIPQLDSLIFLPKRLPKAVKIPKGLFAIAVKFDLAKYYTFDGIKMPLKLKVPLKLKIPQKIKIPDKIKDNIKVQQQKKIMSRINQTKQKAIIKTNIRTPSKFNRIIPKVPPLKPKIPKIKLSPNSKKLENRILTYRGIYRERKNPNLPAGTRNPIVTKSITIRDTKNRALQRVAQRVDTSLVRSMQLQVLGIGKYKRDIQKPSILNKFRMKKSTNTPVLSLVEKAKYLLDARREKMESLRAKLRSKSMARGKISSKNGYKRPKRFK